MALLTTQATILKTYEYSETSKILRLFTRDQGLCSVIARGARRPRSRFGGLLEPFTDGLAIFYLKEGRELHTLSAFELQRERQSLGLQLVRYAGAGLLTEMILRFAPSAPDSDLFFQLRRGLDRLVEDPGDVERTILEEAWRVIERLGFAPHLEECALCGATPGPPHTVQFDLGGGSIICQRCHTQNRRFGLRALEPRARAELRALLRGQNRGEAALKTGSFQRDLLRDFISYHLADHRPLNSFHFLDEPLT